MLKFGTHVDWMNTLGVLILEKLFLYFNRTFIIQQSLYFNLHFPWQTTFFITLTQRNITQLDCM